jgi:hypothetical protein
LYLKLNTENIIKTCVRFFCQKANNDQKLTVSTLIYLSIVGIRDGGGAPGGGGKPEIVNHKTKIINRTIFNFKSETKLLCMTKFLGT